MEARSQLRHRPTKGRTYIILLEHAKSVKRSARGNYPFAVVILEKNESFRLQPGFIRRLLGRLGPGSTHASTGPAGRFSDGGLTPGFGQRANSRR